MNVMKDRMKNLPILTKKEAVVMKKDSFAKVRRSFGYVNVGTQYMSTGIRSPALLSLRDEAKWKNEKLGFVVPNNVVPTMI